MSLSGSASVKGLARESINTRGEEIMAFRKCWTIHRPWSEDCDMVNFKKRSLAMADRLEAHGRIICVDNPEGDTDCMIVGPFRDIPKELDWEDITEHDWSDAPICGKGTFAEEFPKLCPKKYLP